MKNHGQRSASSKDRSGNGWTDTTDRVTFPTNVVSNYLTYCCSEKALQCFDAVGLVAGRASGL